MRCRHFDAGRCRSCTWLPRPYDEQLAAKQEHVRALLAGVADPRWLPPEPSPEEGFRNKAKMVVAGTVDAPTLGILDATGLGVDLRDCGLHEPALREALPVLAEFVSLARLAPYDVPGRRGELKHLLVTAAPSGDLMVRFVTRSQEPVSRLRKHLPWLQERLPSLVVASVNLQPEHKAVLEGDQEILLTSAATLTMTVAGMPLHLRPRSFFQTNTAMAAALYARARTWVDQVAPATVWDLYCGVGGFALHTAGPGRDVHGVEISAEAVASARQSARELGLDSVTFEVGDATTWIRDTTTIPDLVVVNPPRRGLGDALAGWLESSGVRHVVYSSCNAASLARDLAAMPGLAAIEAQVLDMFPQTSHYEVAVLLERRQSAGG